VLAGSIPVVVVLVAILLSTVLHLAGGKAKGDDMHTETNNGDHSPPDPQGSTRVPSGRWALTKTRAATIWKTTRKPIGQCLIVLGEVAAHMAAMVAGSAHWQGPRLDGAALPSTHQ
jgi:hypothetical protein